MPILGIIQSQVHAPFIYEDPCSASFQRYRETKAWWVCPRNPFIDGGRVNPAPFFDTAIRPWHDSPGKWIWGSTLGGFAYGLSRILADHCPDLGNWGAHRRNWDVRWNHSWAMRRLYYLRITRPTLLAGGGACAYWVPRELFSQNFGRRNRKGYLDPLPHIVGSLGFLFFTRPIIGTVFARWAFYWILLGGWYNEAAYAYGFTYGQFQRDYFVPLQYAHQYGLPQGGEGYDMLDGGEHGLEWRLESTTRSPYLQWTKWKVRSGPEYDHHPWFRYDWGHWGVVS
eukprot:TRINITY_DN3740_c1_g4_i2.p1 TRINITY_DN3740_c1_g4~~TRINITY_DN3740_c1_g4_i2.p1  ORF type:complete len:283 (+),score=75.31 TRINITY_DN3740_c1_g4_i2:139-987(+)